MTRSRLVCVAPRSQQCVTNVGDCTAHFRKEIEAMFPKIKAATRVIPGAPKTPKLPAHLSSWCGPFASPKRPSFHAGQSAHASS